MDQDSTIYDLLIIGGGINGVGIAADAAGRGLRVALCEMSDLASATSSASTKLIHGGLRYLEQYEFRLVREALAEREVLLRNAPHIVHPIRFQLPHRPHLRPRWMIRAGLFLYDYLSARVTLPRSRSLVFGEDSPLQSSFKRGFEYSDAQVDDSRLVVLLAMLAREHAASIRTRTRCVAAVENEGIWHVTLEDTRSGELSTLRARMLVNAAGPWVRQLASTVLPQANHHDVRLVKGCHIVVPRIHPGSEAFLLQNSDERVVFVIPWQEHFSLIGTTEEDFTGNPAEAHIAEWEVEYLVGIVNECFRKSISAADVLHSFAGVRPLVGGSEESASKVSRDYTLELSHSPAPVLTVYGGKITTYRMLAESAMSHIREVFPSLPGNWTEHSPLPGADFVSREALVNNLSRRCNWIPRPVLKRWADSYGSLSLRLLHGVSTAADMGREFGHGLTEREVDYLCREEWAQDVDDILWRRSKLGLYFTAAERESLRAYLASRTSG